MALAQLYLKEKWDSLRNIQDGKSLTSIQISSGRKRRTRQNEREGKNPFVSSTETCFTNNQGDR